MRVKNYAGQCLKVGSGETYHLTQLGALQLNLTPRKTRLIDEHADSVCMCIVGSCPCVVFIELSLGVF